tara:strand:+ start:5471 stop:5689 length:219 start_codon:yes stop_codon:yes gene_type:complete
MPAIELDPITMKRLRNKSRSKKSRSKKSVKSARKLISGATGALKRKASAGFLNPEKIASAARLDPVTMKRLN